ncbi:lipoprotein 17-related variable surface protein [Mycoplasma sp. 744]|nr:lipoprotein 17-related variable surface protein [Mycoplasma sp. 744]MEA4115425.1 lipoprotein 17-related variable surface protein [Mycoplasma sp. 744]
MKLKFKKYFSLLSLSSLSLIALASSCTNENEEKIDSSLIFAQTKINFNYQQDKIINDKIDPNLIEYSILDNQYQMKVINLQIGQIDKANGVINFTYNLTFNYKKQTYTSLVRIAQLTNLTFVNKQKNGKENNRSDEMEIKETLNNINVTFSLDDLNILASDVQIEQIKNNLKELDSTLTITNLNILQANDTTGQLIIEYTLEKLVNNEKYQVKKHFTINNLQTKNDQNTKELINKEKERLDELLNNLELTYNNAQEILPSENQKDSFSLINSLYQANLKILAIKNIDDQNGSLDLEIQIQSTKENLQEVTSNTRTINLNIFDSINKRNDKKIKELKEKLNNLEISFDYVNKSNVLASQAQLDNLIYEKNLDDNIKISNIEFIEQNNTLSQVKLTYTLSVSYLKQTLENVKYFTIENFKSLEKYNQEQKQKELQNEKNRLNHLINTLNLDYQNKAQTLPSQVQTDKFILNSQNNDFELQIINIEEKNDTKGTLKVAYQFFSLKNNFENVSSNIRVIELNDFNNLEKLQNQYKQMLNQIAQDKQVSKIFLYRKGNTKDFKASNVLQNDLVALFNPQQKNIDIQIKEIKANDDIGSLEIKYQLSTQVEKMLIKSDIWSAIMFGFKTNDNANREAIDEELKRLNANNFDFNYPNKNQTYALDAKTEQFLTNSNDQIELVEPKIIEQVNQEAKVTLQYRLKSLKTNLNAEIISDILTKEISGFKQGLSLEQLITNEKEKLNKTNFTFAYLNKENTFTEEAKLEKIQITTNNNYQNEELKNLTYDLKTNSISFEYQIFIENFYGQKISSNVKKVTISGFKNKQVFENQNSVDTFLASYTIAENPLINQDLNIKLYSTSISEQNAPYFLNLANNKEINLKIKNIKIDDNNLNQISLTLVAQKGDYTKEEQRTFTFKNDVASLTNGLSFNSIEELYDVDYAFLNSLAGNDLRNKTNLLNSAFSKKVEKLNNLFDYEINWQKSKNDITQVEKKVRDINRQEKNAKAFVLKWNLVVDVKLNGKTIKSFYNLKTADNRNPHDYFGGNYLYTYLLNNDFNVTYKPSQYYLTSAKFNNNKTDEFLLTYINNTAKEIKNTNDKYKDVIIEGRNATLNQNDAINKELFKEIVLKSFDFELNGWKIEEVVSYLNNENDKFNYFYVQPNNLIKLLLKLTKNDQVVYFPLIFNNFNYDINQLEDAFFVNLISGNNISKILSQVKFKKENDTHQNYLASKIYDNLNDFYELLSNGRYQIKFLTKDQTTLGSPIRPVNHFDDAKGEAIVQFGLFENGQYTGISTLGYTLKYFKTREHSDFYPENKWFNVDDFNDDTKYTKPEENIINEINKINSTNFIYNFVQGSPNNEKDLRTRRTLDPKLLVEQKAYAQLNHLLTMINNNSSQKQHDLLKNNTDSVNNVNINNLLRDYYVYYYDVKSSKTNSLTFKLGFINKTNSNLRYSSNKEIILENLYNDYQLEAYPEALINKITLQNFKFKSETLKKQNTSSLISYFNTNKKIDNDYFTITEIDYNNWKLPNWNNLEIAEVKNIKNRIFIRIKYSKYIFPQYSNITKNILGDTWYEIGHFSDWTDDNLTDEQILNFLTVQHNMKKVFLANGKILRQRKIKLNYKDNYFDLSNNKKEITWLFKKDYYEPLLKQNKVTNAKINFEFFTNILYLDENRYNRVLDSKQNLNITLDWNELVKQKTLIFKKETQNVNNIKIDFTLSFTLNEEGINFSYKLDDNNDYLIVANNIAETLYYHQKTLPEVKFDKNKAIYFNQNFGTNVNIQYQNEIENETFSKYQSNKFDYQNLSITPENMPFYIYNEGYNHGELFKYNPNENLIYKWHEGYKPSVEFMHLSYKDQRIKDVNNRVLAFNNGSSLMLGKVNKDEKDGKYYFITNNHVVNNNNTIETPWKNAWKTNANFTLNGTNKHVISADYQKGIDNENATSTRIFTFWTGYKQYNDDGEINVDSKNKLAVLPDLSTYMIDVNNIINNLKKQGKFSAALWFENLKKLPNLGISDYNKDNITYFLEMHKAVNKKPSFANKLNFSTNRLMTGFPGYKQIGYIYNDSTIGTARESYQRTSVETSYSPILFRGGLSGTGVVDDRGNYITSLNAASFYNFATSYYNYSVAWNKDKNKYEKFNWFGFTPNIEQLYKLANKNSLASTFLKLSAWDSTIEIPEWVFNPKQLHKN